MTDPHPRVRPAAFGMLAALLVLTTAACSSSASPTKSVPPTASSQPTPQAAPVGLNQKFHDETLEFTVTKAQCAATAPDAPNRVPQGHFCIVYFDMHNTGTDLVTFEVADQRAYDAAGKPYTPVFAIDDRTDIAAYPQLSAPLTALDVVYDVPMDVTLVVAEFHATTGSAGVRVRLG